MADQLDEVDQVLLRYVRRRTALPIAVDVSGLQPGIAARRLCSFRCGCRAGDES